jgi:hypothetical protein
MATSIIIFTFLVSLTGSESDRQFSETIAAALAEQNTLIEVNLSLTESSAIELNDVVTETTASAVDEPVIHPSTETPEPIGKDFEPLDQIEPLFADEEAEVDAKHVDVPSVVVGDGQVDENLEPVPTFAPEVESVVAPQPATVEDNVGDQPASTVEPGAEPVPIAEPEAIESTAVIPESPPEAIVQTADEPATTTDPESAALAGPECVVEPAVVAEPECVAPAQPETNEESIGSPTAEAGETVPQANDEVEPAVVEDAAAPIKPGEFYDSYSDSLLDLLPAL